MIRPLCAVVIVMLAWPLPAQAQEDRLLPPATIGFDATVGTRPDDGWLAAGPRITIAISARNAIEAGFHRQIDRTARRRRDLAFVQVTRDVHRFAGGALFASVGAAALHRVESAPLVGGFPGFFRDEFNVGVVGGVGIRAEVARRLSIRADAQVVLSDDAFLRALIGLGVPIGGRYPDHEAWRAGRNPAGSLMEDLRLGQHLWVTTDAGLVVEGDAIRRTPTALTLVSDGTSREIPVTRIRQIETTDRLRNGGIWGALAGGIPGAVFGGLIGSALCETDDHCGWRVGIAFGAMTAGVGALAGLVIDSVIDGRRPVRSAARLQAPAAGSRPPAFVMGVFEDDYGNRFTITPALWTLHDSARYHVETWHPDGRFVVLRNDDANPSEPGLWTRIDWVELEGSDPWRWAFCMSVYDAPSAAAAAASTVADPATPRTGCNGYPFSRMKPVERPVP